MDFTVFSPDEMRVHYTQALNKDEALNVLAECSNSTVNEVAAFLGVPFKVKRRGGMKISQRRLYKMFEAGLATREIAKVAGVSHTTINERRKEWRNECDSATEAPPAEISP